MQSFVGSIGRGEIVGSFGCIPYVKINACLDRVVLKTIKRASALHRHMGGGIGGEGRRVPAILLLLFSLMVGTPGSSSWELLLGEAGQSSVLTFILISLCITDW